jgi:tripartite-type tricarboxylate transporter receptor subunit TctC
VAGPPGLPAPVAQTLSDGLVQAMRDPAVIAWARRNSANLQPDDAASTTQLLEQQARFIARWKDYLAAS